MIAPCKNCPSRFLGCHSVCLKYGNYRTEQDALNQKRAEDKKIDLYSTDLSSYIKHKENRKARR